MVRILVELAALVIGVALLGWALWRYVHTRRYAALILDRIDRGLCRRCGYSLRGSVERCAECGRPFRPHEKVPIRRDT